MASQHGSGFNGVRVFSATLARDRDVLGERVTAWIATKPLARIVDVVVSQSSDSSYHCLTMSLFYYELAQS